MSGARWEVDYSVPDWTPPEPLEEPVDEEFTS